jgi:hypothetical protein
VFSRNDRSGACVEPVTDVGCDPAEAGRLGRSRQMIRFGAVRLVAAMETSAERLEPTNPFFTAAYAQAMCAVGYDAWELTGVDADGETRATVGFMKVGRLSRSFLLPSMPRLSDTAPFWTGLVEFCRRHRVTDLSLSSAASAGVAMPTIAGERERIPRTEFVLDLDGSDPWARVGRSHRERIKKARKHGLGVVRSRDEAALAAHVALHEHSMQRRARRGENVPLDQDDAFMRALLATGAAELYQAVRDGRVLSSLLMVRSRDGAYSQSSGNSSEGMGVGASHFLRYETALLMRDGGVRSFFLGGCRAHEDGLRAYKEGFGARAIAMTSMEVYLGTELRRCLTTAARLLRHDPLTLARDLLGRREHYVAYMADPAAIAPPLPVPGWVIQKLTDDELWTLPVHAPELRAQGDRLAQGRVNDAWGLRIDGVLAGICWLIPEEHDRQYRVRNVKLRRREVEITHCVTLPEFRGRGVYPYMIRSLCIEAASQGAQRVFMITDIANMASQRGMEKAGLTRHGAITRWELSSIPGDPSFTWRGHR